MLGTIHPSGIERNSYIELAGLEHYYNYIIHDELRVFDRRIFHGDVIKSRSFPDDFFNMHLEPRSAPRRISRLARPRRRGTQVIEMVIAFQVLLYLTFGMVEFGQYLYIKHCFESAVRDGARYATLSTATQAQTVSTISTTLLQSNVTFNSSWLTINDITAGTTVTDVSQVPAGDQMQFILSTTYANIANAVRPLYSMTGYGIGNGKVISANCIVLKE